MSSQPNPNDELREKLYNFRLDDGSPLNTEEIDRLLPLFHAHMQSMVQDVIGEDEHMHPDDPQYNIIGEPFEWAERNSGIIKP